MNMVRLKAHLQFLKDLRDEINGKVDDSVIFQIDEIIANLEEVEDQDDYLTDELKSKSLLLFGVILGHLPEIAEAIDKLLRYR